MNILTPIMVLGILGFLFGTWLFFAYKIFSVKTDPRIEQILGILPGINCGACGNAGCQGFAVALVKGETDISGCAPGGEDTHKRLSALLGMEIKHKTRQTATLICSGGINCKDKYIYYGPKNCSAANILQQGHKACDFGCLGFGDCASVCPFNAITMGPDKLPVIDADKCTACGKCVSACPKNVIILTDIDKQYHITCNSLDKGAWVMKICSLGCIGCGKCVKNCPVNAIILKDNLARIDYDKCINCGKCFEVCPTKAITKTGLTMKKQP